jgi:hypothetical protein
VQGDICIIHGILSYSSATDDFLFRGVTLRINFWWLANFWLVHVTQQNYRNLGKL